MPGTSGFDGAGNALADNTGGRNEFYIFMVSMLGKMDCSRADQIAEETYTRLLGMVDQYQVIPNKLELYTEKCQRLIFEASPED